jgi:predicted Zn-dependent protease
MATDWQTLEEAEDHAYFMAELVDISPESFTLEEKRKILDDMLEASSAIENRMRDDFAELDEVTQTRLLDSLGTSGYRDRDWWYRMLMDGSRHRDRPTI